jgi:hypothetical protein
MMKVKQVDEIVESELPRSGSRENSFLKANFDTERCFGLFGTGIYLSCRVSRSFEMVFERQRTAIAALRWMDSSKPMDEPAI